MINVIFLQIITDPCGLFYFLPKEEIMFKIVSLSLLFSFSSFAVDCDLSNLKEGKLYLLNSNNSNGEKVSNLIPSVGEKAFELVAIDQAANKYSFSELIHWFRGSEVNNLEVYDLNAEQTCQVLKGSEVEGVKVAEKLKNQRIRTGRRTSNKSVYVLAKFDNGRTLVTLDKVFANNYSASNSTLGDMVTNNPSLMFDFRIIDSK